MELIQKKGSIKHTFTFHDEHFNFAYQEKSGSGDTDVEYADFPQKSSVQIEQNEWLRNVGYLWVLLGIFQIGYAIYSDGSLSGKGFWLVVGAACVLWSLRTKIKYSVFRAESGNIFVIQDGLHDSIIDEINSRRKAQLLRWYGDLNPNNELQQEVNKFKWLVEQGALTKDESDQKIAQAELLRMSSPGNPSERLN